MTTTQSRLNQIETRWTLVQRAHGQGTLAAAARRDLLERYCGAAWRYMRALTRDEALAEELLQEFALRLIRGDFRRVAAQRGRFRQYLKAAIINLVKDHYRSEKQRPLPLPAHVADRRVSLSDVDEPQDAFLESWREELLCHTWVALEQTSASLHAVLRLHAAFPEATAAEKAERLSQRLGEPVTPNRFRVMLHRAREKFSTLLKREVAMSLGEPADEELRNELHQLRLLRYCEG